MRLDSIQTITRSAAKNISSAPRPAPVLLVPSSSTAITLFNYPPSLSDQMTSLPAPVQPPRNHDNHRNHGVG